MTTSSEQGHPTYTYKESAARVADALDRANPQLGGRLRHAIFRLAREYAASSGHAPSPEELRDELKRRFDPKTQRLKFDFARSADPLGYLAVFKHLTAGHTNLPAMVDYLHEHRYALMGLKKLVSSYLTPKQTEPELMKKLGDLIHYGMIAHIDAFLDEMDAKPGETMLYGRNKLLLLMESYARFNEQYAISDAVRARMPDFLKASIDQAPTSQKAEHKTYEELRRAHPEMGPREVTGLELIFDGKIPAAFDMDTYRYNRSEIAYEYHNIRMLNVAAAMMTLLMPERDATMKYFKTWGSWLKNPAGHPLTQCLRHLSAQSYDPQIDYKAWGDGMMRYGPRFAFYFGYASKLKSPALDKSGQPSLQKTRALLMDNAYAESLSDPNLARFCFNRSIPEKDFNTAAELMRRYSEPDASPAGIPDYIIAGEKFGLPGTRLSRLQYDDPRLLFIGTYTGCCEYIGSACDETITHAVSTRRSAFYAITDNASGQILAHSWLWISPTQYLIFDGFETASPRITGQVISDATRFFALTLEQMRLTEKAFPDIRAVALGKSGNNIPLPSQPVQIGTGEILPLTPFRDLAEADRALINRKDKPRMGDSSEFRLIRSFEPPPSVRLLPAP